MSFGRAFALLGVDVLALNCSKSLTIVQQSPHSNTVLVLTEDATQFDHVVFEKHANLGLSVAPDFRKIIVSAPIGPVVPKVSCTFRPKTQRYPDFEVQVPVKRERTSVKACAGVAGGQKDVLVTGGHKLIVSDSISVDMGFAWQLKKVFPVISVLGKFENVSGVAVLGLEKQKVKAQYVVGGLRAFCELAHQDGELREKKIGAVLENGRVAIGARLDLVKMSAKAKGEVRHPGWSVVGMARLGRDDGVRGQVGGECFVKDSRLRCVCGSDATAVVEWKKSVTRKVEVKAQAKHKRENGTSRVCYGLQLKFDHD